MNKPRSFGSVAFSEVCVLVLVDGSFWRGCPGYVAWPKHNAEYWRTKSEANMDQDNDNGERGRADGRKVVGVWVHEESEIAQGRIPPIIERRRRGTHRA